MSMAASRPACEPPLLVVVMGVSGCGKTSVGARLAARLRLPFIEGDSLHPAANIEKMAAGIPLQDEDRWPWLARIGAAISAAAAEGQGLVIACSALKRAYRDRLNAAAGGRLFFVFLYGGRALLRERMRARTGHFMPAALLDSQLATLEDPRGEAHVVAVDIAMTVEEIVAAALKELERSGAVLPQEPGTH
ncbi:gluconokinase [Chelativorans intermedius]|uniref:Gluconokinase n=1 Tax=Chelativorans intermedius TaxID=515947 RepID=A0ABV6D657_9HYPH|nr:gluconokinase [Chelativorans intermedius]MCT8999371.1 gluconokinase [Chelativorans intermedius]